MTHVFVAPHPDDVALSCGGLIASLRELGQTVTILTVFSGVARTADGYGDGLTDYQREALGFGSKHRAYSHGRTVRRPRRVLHHVDCDGRTRVDVYVCGS